MMIVALSAVVSLPAFATTSKFSNQTPTPASASTVVTRNDRIAYGVNLSKSSNRIYFQGGVKKTDATEAYAQEDGWFNGESVSGMGSQAKNDAYVSDYVPAQQGYYEMTFYGYVIYGPNAAYEDWCQFDKSLANGTSTNSSDASQKTKAENFINNLGDQILAGFGYSADNYTKVEIADKGLPFPLVNYYFTELPGGLGSSKPIIYKSKKDSNQYIITFQDPDGKNIVEVISLNSNNNLFVEEKAMQSTKVHFVSSSEPQN